MVETWQAEREERLSETELAEVKRPGDTEGSEE